ncbi:HAMP domain-containing sensor histidine kinase [Nocardia jinanensis]|uniref:histidine kinase n=1 Tax=Nocardia jinanensis TaxID=382504 RepID=A0A917VY02_9NOCA|nr:ATP-binding protein [Nocardia jinanensis]GGL42762.1 histidine kinase [Nocardia jinanensis]
METPRPWQFSLSNWSVTRKVGIVLVLPVVLATLFAVLRINNELRTLEQLEAATEQSRIIGPIVGYNAAAEHLAVTATAGWADNRAPQATAALAGFDTAHEALERALDSNQIRPGVSRELSSALTLGSTMRSGLSNGSPAMVGDQADEIAVRIGNALAQSPTVEDLSIQRYFLQVSAIQNARRSLTAQRLVISSPTAEDNPAMRARILTSGGAELTMIHQYGQIMPDVTGNMRPLLDAVQTRLAIFSQGTQGAMTDPAALESLDTSSQAYQVTTDQLTATISGALHHATVSAQNSALRETALLIAALLGGLTLALAVARTLVVPVRRLRRDALEVAHVRLPEELERVRGGADTPEIEPVGVHGTEEIGQLARAVDEMHQQALNLAAEQARLRVQIGNMFETLSRRSQSLVEQQLGIIEELEHDEDDPQRLQSLFRLDHLATRMRRNGDNLLVIAGTPLRRGQLEAVPLSDMLWSAVSQVEDYQRVEIGHVPDGVVAGEPAVDIEHLLAEVIDNALRYSPPNTPVAVTVSRAVDGGYLIEITDRGLGMANEDLQAANARLASGGEINIETARRMGLFVVGRLAKRHQITVGLRRTSTMAQQPGITASLHLPGLLVSPDTGPDNSSILTAGPSMASPPQLQQTSHLQHLPQLQEPPAPRQLTPVPDLPSSDSWSSRTDLPPVRPLTQAPSTSGFGTTSTGLPQRRPATPAPLGLGGNTSDGSGTRDTFSAFDPVPETPPTEDSPTGLWSETYKTQSFPPPVDFPAPTEHRSVTEPEPPALTARSGLPIRRPGMDYEDPFGRSEPRRNEPVATTTTASRLQPVGGETPTPIYQRMVSEWLVEPATTQEQPRQDWTTPADIGWLAAEDAARPSSDSKTANGLPIRRPGAQLVPGGLAPVEDEAPRDPTEIRSNLTRHLSGVRTGRADAQNNDGGLA